MFYPDCWTQPLCAGRKIFKVVGPRRTCTVKFSAFQKGDISSQEGISISGPYAPIPSASGFGVGFGYLNTF